MRRRRKTKILATLGPASSAPDQLKKLEEIKKDLLDGKIKTLES